MTGRSVLEDCTGRFSAARPGPCYARPGPARLPPPRRGPARPVKTATRGPARPAQYITFNMHYNKGQRESFFAWKQPSPSAATSDASHRRVTPTKTADNLMLVPPSYTHPAHCTRNTLPALPFLLISLTYSPCHSPAAALLTS